MREIIAIALNTHREALRSKVLYGCLAVAIVMIGISSTFSSVTVGDEHRLIADFGLALNSLVGVGFLVISGSRLLAQELNRRTIFNLLSRPISRSTFVIGKFLGLLTTTATISFLLALGLWSFLSVLSGSWEWGIWYGFVMQLCELGILCALVLLFSSIVVTPALNGLFVFGAFLAGRSTPFLFAFTQDGEMPQLLRDAALLLYWGLPHLNQLYVANEIVYRQLPSIDFMLQAGVYSMAYTGACLTLACILFRRRQFV
jgi:ABC-type transport system involved in multi-copper enzyme maturation permease subunit